MTHAPPLHQLPISAHGLIGDLRTAALVGDDGRIDWFCAPRFDSPSLFGALLDTDRGGHWRIGPEDPAARSRQFYLPDTNVLVTRFSTADGVVELRDFMVIVRAKDADHRQCLVRQVQGIRGRVRLRVDVAPRFDYGRARHTAQVDGDRIRFASDGLAVDLLSSVPLEVDGSGDAAATLEVGAGDGERFLLGVLDAPDAPPAAPPPVPDLLEATIAFWRDWIARSTYRGRWRESVERSALTLKLLTHEPSGAIIAAPTTSLPEEIGGQRNWDYRHVWIRDAAFSLYALLRLGYLDEAEAFMRWLTDRIAEPDGDGHGPLRAMYDIDGASTAGEFELDHLSGFRGSRPVRVRNDAAEQLQLDLYGELIDSVYLFDKYGSGISYDTWQGLVRMAGWLQENWQRADEGLWETRGGRSRNTFSRVMSWVAFERLMRMSRSRGRPGPLTEWGRTRDEIMRTVFEEHWSERLGAFVQSAGSEVLDASMLLMASVKFVTPTDPRFVRTVEAIERRLVTDSLVFRYDRRDRSDGVEGDEGTFSMCSFWYVEALTRTGRTADARLAFEKMLTYANPLGLFAEEVAVDSEQIGNFPQAFTHLSLISAAINLDRVLP